MADMNAPSGQTPTMAPPVRADDQILPHIRANTEYAERIWEEFTQSIHTFIEDKRNLSRNTSWKKRATLIVIPSIWFTKMIIHHLQRKHRFHPRPDSPLYMSNEEPVLGYLKFSTKGTKREIFRMPIPGRLIMENIREASYYQEYQENVAKHRGFLAGETGSTQDLPVPKPAKPARKPQSTAQKAPPKPSISSPATETTDKPAKTKRIKRSVSCKTRQPRCSPKSVGASEAEEVPDEEPQVADEDADYQKAMEESMKDAYALPKGPLPPVVIRELESGKYQPIIKVPGKGKAKVTEEQVAHDLLSLQRYKKTSPADQYIFQRRVFEPTASSFHDESPYEAGPDPDVKAEDQTGSDAGAQAEGQAGPNPDETSEGQAGSNPDETSEGQAGPDPGNAKARVQSTLSSRVYAGSDREHMDLDVANVSPQPSTEQLDEGFTATVYPNVQENLKLAIEELDHGVKSSQNPPPIDECCCDCGNALDGIFCQQCICKSCGKGAHIGYNCPPKVSIAVSEVVTDAVDWAMQVPLRNCFRDLPEADMKEILHQRMWEFDSYKSHEDHMQLFEALEKSMNRDHSEELTHDLAEARKKRKKAGPSGMSRAPRASGSQVTPPPPPPTSTNQDSLSKGSAALSPSKTAATTEHQAWTTPDVTLKPLISLTLADLDMDEAMGPDEQA
nr:hypothetical protein [Tanacetum cinerariifolium]